MNFCLLRPFRCTKGAVAYSIRVYPRGLWAPYNNNTDGDVLSIMLVRKWRAQSEQHSQLAQS
jgi:hypothetical protein